MRVGGNVRVIRLALPVILSLFPFNAQALEAAFDGAWLESGSTTCEEVFTRKRKIGFIQEAHQYILGSVHHSRRPSANGADHLQDQGH